MDKRSAALLIASMVERAARDGSLGSISSLERQSLLLALEALDSDTAAAQRAMSAPIAPPNPVPVSEVTGTSGHSTSAAPVQIQTLPKVTLNLESLKRKRPTNPDVLLCLDFGTAMSKAFASVAPDSYLELELGAAVGQRGFALPSSVFIADDGRVFFGQDAIDQSESARPGRERLDSIKGWLTLNRSGNLDGVLAEAINPHGAVKLTQGDLLRLYFAFLTDAAGLALGSYRLAATDVGRHVLRRFARPCWPDSSQAKWADRLMRDMLADAQIIADTMSGRWVEGLHIGFLKAVLEQVKSLSQRPEYLIDLGVPEPVAVAAGTINDSENMRDAFMVVDAGAGTTDFGFFVATHLPDGEAKVFQVAASIQGLMQAGDKVDGMLRIMIARKEAIDSGDTPGRLLLADLSRRIRSMKEALFKQGFVEYAFPDGTTGRITKEEFLAEQTVRKFADLVNEGFQKALEAVDETYLRWLAMPGVRLNVVLTGGSSQLPMMKALASGVLEVRGHKIVRQYVNPAPEWLETAPQEFVDIYPQLAVAIGGTTEELPETYDAPLQFAGGARKSQYVAGRLQISGI